MAEARRCAGDPLCFDARLATASCFWSICFMRFHMHCNLKTAPNIGELSLVSALQTSGPYALGHPPPPLAIPLAAHITYSALHSYWNSKDKITLLAVESRHFQLWWKDEYERKLQNVTFYYWVFQHIHVLPNKKNSTFRVHPTHWCEHKYWDSWT